MKQYIIKIEPSKGCQQLYTLNINDQGQLDKLYMVIVHNGLESRIILNTIDLVKECGTRDPATPHQLDLIKEIFKDMIVDSDDLISVEQEEQSSEQLIAANDMANEQHPTDFDEIIKRLSTKTI